MDKPRGEADSLYRLIRHFHEAAGIPVAEVPHQLAPARLSARVEWLREEVTELEAATTFVDQVDAVVDVIYVALGTLVEMGVELEGPLQLVHECNLAKAWPDGTFRKSENGKIIKPDNWTSPREGLSRLLADLSGPKPHNDS